MGKLVVKVTAETKENLGKILQLTNSGLSPKEVGAELGKSGAYVSRIIQRLPKIIAALEATPA